jgi:dUTP pyrophosphatase
MQIKIKKLHPDAVIPQYAKVGDAGIDLHALEDVTVFKDRVTLVKTGLAVAIPEGYVGYVCSRSGLALKQGVFIPNDPGVVDSGYRGDVGVFLTYNGQPEKGRDNSVHYCYETKVIKGVAVNEMIPGVQFPKGSRVGQLIIQKVEKIEWDLVQDLDVTERGDGGFGSSGV